VLRFLVPSVVRGGSRFLNRFPNECNIAQLWPLVFRTLYKYLFCNEAATGYTVFLQVKSLTGISY
jgi:hypothetical protein